MSKSNRHKTATQSIYICLLLVFFGILVFGAKQLSLTSDEPPHLIHGYLMLKTGNPWALPDHRHPPLSNMLSASLLLLQPEQPDPTQVSSWNRDFVLFVRAIWSQLGPIERLAYITRYPNMLLSLIVLGLVIRWTRELSHPKAAVFAALLLVLDPTLIAHGQLNTTDMSLTLFALFSMYLVSKISKESQLKDFAFVGISLGCAMAVKASGLLLAPVVYVVLFWRVIHMRTARDVPFKTRLRTILVRFLTGGVIISIFSGFLLVIVYSIPRIFSPETSLMLNLTAHVEMISMTLTERYRSAFLAGEIRQEGWWWYFPFAFLIKTPIPTILIVIMTAFFAIVHPRKLPGKIALWLFPATYLFSSIRSNLNIGYRHLIPIFPFVYIGAGNMLYGLLHHPYKLLKPVGKSINHRSPSLLRLILILLILWQAADLALVYPFSLAYFNAFAGGPKNGYRYLVDSNVDWGQSFIALKSYMKSEEIPWIWLSYYTWIDPSAYDITYKPLPPSRGMTSIPQRFNPTPGVYALSATPLQGVMMAEPSMYDWFRHKTPDSQPGYGLLVYHVQPPVTQPDWVAQCSKPVPPLSATDLVSGFGVNNLRIILFDCENAWIYPQNGEQPGWFLLHKDIVDKKDSYIINHLKHSRISYQQTEPGMLPAFTIYEYTAEELPPVNSTHVTFGDAELILEGYIIQEKTAKTGASFDIVTKWSINKVPTRPLSLMLHLVHNQTGGTFVGDGLGVPISEWGQGDILFQRHKITLPENLVKGTYSVIAGVYWLDNLERWEPSSTENAFENAVLLTQIKLD